MRRGPSHRRWRFVVVVLWLARGAVAGTTAVDFSAYDPAAGVRVDAANGRLVASWPVDDARPGERGVVEFSLDDATPLIARLALADGDAAAKPVLENVTPCGVWTVGTRDLKPAGWTVFFDNPPKRPWQAFALAIGREKVRVVTEDGRTSVRFAGTTAGPFAGEFRFTFYPGGRLVRAAAVMRTDRPSTAFLFDSGLAAPAGAIAPWKGVAYTGLNDAVVRRATDADAAKAADAEARQVRHRLIVAEGRAGGGVAILPPPHQYFYPLDSVDNLASAWSGRNWRGLVPGDALGVRQTIEGDKRWVPWVNAPPGTTQDCGVFYLLSDGDATQATADALAYTRGDAFKRLAGYKTFTSHYHVEHTIDFLNEQRDQHTAGVPKGLETPEFVTRFKAMNVDAVHLAEFHLGEGDMQVADRLTRLKTLHAECARLSDDNFLLLPGEEPNVHLGGHWISFFPKPVYWMLGRKAGEPFVADDTAVGRIYRVGNADDVLKLMEAENGLMWTAHPRIKASTGFPDQYMDRNYFKSDHFLGGAWKAMPADYSLPRLGTRVLGLLDDMNQSGGHKQSPGEVDVFKIDKASELYAHMNVNYLRLDRLPAFADGWRPVLDALRGGRFFTTTGEVLLPAFAIDGVQSGGTLRPGGPSRVTATVEWTFPPAFAELVSGDGSRLYRDRLPLGETKAFGRRDITATVDLRGRAWARLEVWDVATDGAFTQPIWVGR